MHELWFQQNYLTISVPYILKSIDVVIIAILNKLLSEKISHSTINNIRKIAPSSTEISDTINNTVCNIHGIDQFI